MFLNLQTPNTSFKNKRKRRVLLRKDVIYQQVPVNIAAFKRICNLENLCHHKFFAK